MKTKLYKAVADFVHVLIGDGEYTERIEMSSGAYGAFKNGLTKGWAEVSGDNIKIEIIVRDAKEITGLRYIPVVIKESDGFMIKHIGRKM